MENIKACRVCLITGVRMNDLRCYPFMNYFEAFIGASPLDEINFPPYACYECMSYLRKTLWFREKCLRGQESLYNLLNTAGKITEEGIKKIDRLHLNLISRCKIDVLEYVDIVDKNPVVYDVKIEPPNEYEVMISNESFNGVEPNNHEAVSNQDEKPALDIDYFKEEFNGLSSPLRFSSDDDNEPLSFHKSNKEKGVKKKIGKKKGRRKKDSNNDLQNSEAETKERENNETVTKDQPAEPVQRRKRGRPRRVDAKPRPEAVRRTKNTGGVENNEVDLEEYVTIIKLTKEEQIEEIQKRQHSSNYLNAPYKCNLCFKGFINTDAWKHHVSKHQPSPGDLECPICKFRFKTKRNLQKHSSNHEMKFACKSCPYVSKTTTQAKQHQRWHIGVTYKCQYCDEVATKWTSYLSHVRMKHPSEFICSVCGYSFVSQLGLNMHKTMMHKDVVEKEKEEGDETGGPFCAVCDVKFVSMEAYRRHMVTSAKHIKNDEVKHGCRVCGATFPTGEELRVHHRRQHARARPRNYGKRAPDTAWPAACRHCQEIIPSARDYWTHFRRAHPDKPYPIQKNYICDICGKSFRGNAFLVYHKRTHTEERAYKCGQCPKAFFNRINLQMHEKTHSDQRPYPCTVCFKAFKSKGALDRHNRSHTGVKPYECEVCGKAFGQSNSRKLHVRTVHLRQPAPYLSRARRARQPPAPAPAPAPPAYRY